MALEFAINWTINFQDPYQIFEDVVEQEDGLLAGHRADVSRVESDGDRLRDDVRHRDDVVGEPNERPNEAEQMFVRFGVRCCNE